MKGGGAPAYAPAPYRQPAYSPYAAYGAARAAPYAANGLYAG